MHTTPMVPNRHRDKFAATARWALFIPRAFAWILGAIFGSIVAGLLDGWRDVA